ncbi:MAG: DUF4974 domain-containing protein [Bacteroidetes bacterium]|nr:MAG: DUF4974 domain-containing protein [Bacteroidota bacterium]
MENTADIWQLVARVLNGEASATEQQELMAILREDEALAQQYDLLNRIWKEQDESTDFQDREAAQSIISRIITKAEFEDSDLTIEAIGRKSRLKKRRAWMAIAAMAVVAATGWLLLNNGSRPNNNTSKNDVARESEAIEAKKGSRTSSRLPDGTTVWLNAGSKLYYDDNFSGTVRSVRLEGEAFFDVVKQPKHPFIVHTAGIDIKVLGTAFNVKSYPEDKTVETTLYRGSVKVFREEESEEKAIQLRPNEKLILQKNAAKRQDELSSKDIKPLPIREAKTASFTIAHIDSTKKESERFETAWLYSRLEFRGDNFEELARKLERWYNITITFTDEKVKHLSFDGSFQGETVEQAFKYLREANSLFNYNINNHEISVGSAK